MITPSLVYWVGIASFASALIEYNYSLTVARRTTTIPLARISGPRVIKYNVAVTSSSV